MLSGLLGLRGVCLGLVYLLAFADWLRLCLFVGCCGLFSLTCGVVASIIVVVFDLSVYTCLGCVGYWFWVVSC